MLASHVGRAVAELGGGGKREAEDCGATKAVEGEEERKGGGGGQEEMGVAPTIIPNCIIE